MLMDWYYTAGTDQKGPVTESDLQQLARDGVITAQTYLWKAGMAAWEPAPQHPALAGLIPTHSAPPDLPPAGSTADGVASAVIPYKNVPALVGYYLGVFGIIPTLFIIGGFFGIVPLVLGIIGLKRAKANPTAKGKVHAWVAIVLGTIELLVPIGFIAAAALSVAFDSQTR